MPKKVSSDLVCAVAVILAGAAGGGYFYQKGEEPLKVVMAVKPIQSGRPISPADVKQTTIKRREITTKWLKAPDIPRGTRASDIPFDSILVGDPNEIKGEAVGDIQPGQFIYTGAPGDFFGTAMPIH